MGIVPHLGDPSLAQDLDFLVEDKHSGESDNYSDELHDVSLRLVISTYSSAWSGFVRCQDCFSSNYQCIYS